MTISSSRKKSPVTYSEVPLFFSLTDYRNNYFTSDEHNKIIEFYNGFENRDQLIRWMKERPKGVANILEVDGNRDIIVVIPTANFNGKYAKECREKIFKGYQIIFVESGEVPDPYFNYSHNCNVGISKAMEYDPKWIIVSNDDMFKIDDISKLRKCLIESSHNANIVLSKKNGNNLSYISIIGKLNIFGNFLINILHIFPVRGMRFSIDLLLMLKKFNIRYISISQKWKIFKNLLFQDKTEIMNVNDFVILRSCFVKNRGGMLFDETFINGYEDLDLTISILAEDNQIDFIDYRIGDYSGGTLGISLNRTAREIANLAYFNSKYDGLKPL